jgi:hypothetical protein
MRPTRARELPRPFLNDPQHRRARRALDLYPASHAPATVRQIAAFRDDAFEPKLASVLEDDGAVAPFHPLPTGPQGGGEVDDPESSTAERLSRRSRLPGARIPLAAGVLQYDAYSANSRRRFLSPTA